MTAFIFLCAITAFFVVMGVATYRKKDNPAGFWANIRSGPVKDVMAYNRAVGKLWIVFGAVLFLLGLPVLQEQNTGGIVIMILGMPFLVIGTIAFYLLVIDRKYRE